MKSCDAMERTAQILSDTWTMLIMHALNEGEKRFCELERELSGISTRTLINKLRKLEEEKLVKKTLEGHYQATEKGKGLKVIEKAMRTYGEKYL
ncbi:MAG: helix-turn-helix domain-containing protein [Patescibacteria group bacterium]